MVTGDWKRYLEPQAWHPAARIFPLIKERELAELSKDIKENGLLSPIVLLGTAVLDGRNRLLACASADVEPWFVQWKPIGDIGPATWVISQNLKRRHLTSSQGAACAVEALPLLEEEARKRQLSHLKRGNERPVPQTIAERGEAREKAAQLFNTNREYVEDLKAIRRRHPSLYAAVKNGDKTIPQAKRELGLERNRITVIFNPGIASDKKILDFLLRLPRKTRSDTVKEILLEAMEQHECPYPTADSAVGGSPSHVPRETQEPAEDEATDAEELIDSIVDSFMKS